MTRTSSLSEQSGVRGLISSEQNFVDCSKPDICETVDIHSEVPRHVETVALLVHQKSTEYFHVTYEVDAGKTPDDLKGKATYVQIKEWIKKRSDCINRQTPGRL